MGQLINMKQVKKRTARNDAAKTAETNRARFGRTKNEKKRDQMNADRARNAVDLHHTGDETAK